MNLQLLCWRKRTHTGLQQGLRPEIYDFTIGASWLADAFWLLVLVASSATTWFRSCAVRDIGFAAWTSNFPNFVAPRRMNLASWICACGMIACVPLLESVKFMHWLQIWAAWVSSPTIMLTFCATT